MIGMDPTAESSAGSLLALLRTDVIQTWINVTKLHFFEGFQKKDQRTKAWNEPITTEAMQRFAFFLVA